MLMESKVRKPGAILIMGAITALLYFVTGQLPCADPAKWNVC